MAKQQKKRASLLEDNFDAALAPPDGRKDEEILYASVKKPKQFELLVDRYQDAFGRKVRSILGPREEVDDIVQEAFVKMYLNAKKFHVQEGASFKSWAYKVLLNTTFTHYQKLKKRDGAQVVVEQDLYESFADETDLGLETNDFVASLLCRLPAHLSRVLKLHFLDGMPQKEIAQLEGVSVSAVKTRIHRAKKEFKKVNSSLG